MTTKKEQPDQVPVDPVLAEKFRTLQLEELRQVAKKALSTWANSLGLTGNPDKKAPEISTRELAILRKLR
jgi:hypothetical protein